jgi:hypothetical protein
MGCGGAATAKIPWQQNLEYLTLMTKKRLWTRTPVSPVQQVQPKFSAANNILLIDRASAQIVVMEHR